MSSADRPVLHSVLRDRALGARVLLAVAAVVTALAGAPTYVVGLFTLLALVGAVERLARRGQGGLDSLLLTVGGVLVALVLTGVLLGSTPIGLRTATWGAGLGIVSLGLLAVAAFRPRPEPLPRADRAVALKALPWAVAVVAVAAGAITLSVRSIGPAEAAPVQMSLGTVDGGEVQVVVSASERTGPVELRTRTEDGTEIDYPLFTVPAGRTYKATVAVPDEGRYVISLVRPEQTQPLRSLILDR